MPPHEARVVDACDDGRLHPAHVGDDRTSVGCPPRLRRDCRHGHGDEAELGIGVDTHRVQRAQFEGARGARFIEITAGDMPAPCPQRQPDGTTDEPGADDLSPGGHREGPWRPRGTHDGARSGIVRS